MNVQGLLVVGAALVAVLFFGRKALRNLGRKGEGAGCCCEGGGGGACGKRKRRTAARPVE
jgi:hypothetical protein